MKIGCIVLNYGTAKQTKRNVDILIDNNEDVFVVIVDNNSPSNDYVILSDYYKENKKVDVILSPNNGGYSRGNNFGIKYVLKKYKEIEYIAIMNPDVRCEEKKLLFDLTKKLEKDSDMVIIAPLMIEGNQINTQKIGWKVPTFKELLISKMYFCGRYLKSRDDKYIPISENGILRYDIVQGSFFIIKREIFQKINFFDENVFMYSEENILAAKIKEEKIRGYAGVDLTHYYIHEHNYGKKNLSQRKKTLSLQFRSENYFVKEYCKFGICKKIILKLFGWFYLNVEIVIADMVKRIVGVNR